MNKRYTSDSMIWVCSDCYLLAEGSGTDTEPEICMAFHERSQIEQADLVVLIGEENEITFSKASCEWCGTHLAGRRHIAEVQHRREVEAS